jgi:asparagine synthase (glutamine-hydrolysing)
VKPRVSIITLGVADISRAKKVYSAALRRGLVQALASAFGLRNNPDMLQPVSRIVNLLDPGLNRLSNMTLDEACRRVLGGDPEDVRGIDGSFAVVAAEGITVRLARSLDRPMRYFLAKRHEGPALYIADRIDTLHDALTRDGLASQFHPSYTRMVPAHYVVEIALVGCPDPDPVYTRFFTPRPNALPATLDEIGRHYVGALAGEIEKWLRHVDAEGSPAEPIGVLFSGGIDSGAVFLVTYHTMVRFGLSPARLKAFVLNLGAGPDRDQARTFLADVGLSLFLEEIDASPDGLDVTETLRVLEDYKPLDVECAAMGLELCRGIRARYPHWRHLADGDGGDENLKDYPIEENQELTIRSVIDNVMLYQEGWGVGRIKHSLTYSGGLSRSYVRTYAPARRHGFVGFSPYTQPAVVEVAEGIPFAALTQYDVPALYALKGEIVGRGVKAVTGFDMPIFPKRRFQHGAMPAEAIRSRLGGTEQAYRRAFHALYT